MGAAIKSSVQKSFIPGGGSGFDPVEKSHRLKVAAELRNLLRHKLAVRQSRGANIDTEHPHHRFRGSHVAVAGQKLHEPRSAKLFLARGFHYTASKGREEAMVNGRREIIGAADRAFGSHGKGAEQVFIHTERHVPYAAVC